MSILEELFLLPALPRSFLLLMEALYGCHDSFFLYAAPERYAYADSPDESTLRNLMAFSFFNGRAQSVGWPCWFLRLACGNLAVRAQFLSIRSVELSLPSLPRTWTVFP